MKLRWIACAPLISAGSVGCYGERVVLASGSDWASFEEGASRSYLGPAQPICIGQNAPPACPEGALYLQPDDESYAWTADLAAIPGASWIWRADVTPTGLANQTVTFERAFLWPGRPSGVFHLAADDFAELLVNGWHVGATGSVSDPSEASQAQSALKEFDITPYLRHGANRITVRAANGPWPCEPDVCSYAEAPAGVVFGGIVDY